jgi:hypothetical protein
MKRTTLALFISILALFFRTYVAYHGPIEPDESVYITAASQYNLAARQGDWKQILDSTYNFEHPQFYKLVYAVGLIAGKPILNTASIHGGNDIQTIAYWHHLFVLRMISVVFGAATVFLVSLINPLAGLFLAIDTYAIKYTSVIYLEALPAFTSLAALMAALKSLKAYQISSRNRKVWIGWLVLSSLLLGMAAASKYIYSLVGIVIIISIIIQGWKHKSVSLIGLACWGLLTLAFFFIFDPILWHNPLSELVKSVNFNFNYSVGQDVKEAGYPFWQPIKWLMISIPQYAITPAAFFLNKGDYFISADSFIFILALVGLLDIFKENKPMFIWLVVGLVFLLLWNTKWPQYILLILVPFCISAAYGFNFLHKRLIKWNNTLKERRNLTTIG